MTVNEFIAKLEDECNGNEPVMIYDHVRAVAVQYVPLVTANFIKDPDGNVVVVMNHD